ncbi:hypothetical protein ACIQXF_09265, partial [Lysinibacillus sp. NPDC097231]|uniref:hypothetical protein n=1 Tax=Lysinibacillus sp. NPDC097231 TaxID=3364142 RepID=UPI0038244D33
MPYEWVLPNISDFSSLLSGAVTLLSGFSTPLSGAVTLLSGFGVSIKSGGVSIKSGHGKLRVDMIEITILKDVYRMTKKITQEYRDYVVKLVVE